MTLQSTLQNEEENSDLTLTELERVRDQVTINIANLQADRESILAEIRLLQQTMERKTKRMEELRRFTVAQQDDQTLIDFHLPLPWEEDVYSKNAMRKLGVDEFCLCQRGVVNAVLQDRDVLVVMPPGSGQSLTYQLPAILTAGLTLVISPSLSMMNEELCLLEGLGIELVGQTAMQSEQDAINARLKQMVLGDDGGQKPFRLLYCTPETLFQSPWFLMNLRELADAKRLAQIVINEAHCVIEQVLSFCSDYKKLDTLRQLFPDVPIMALSAACPPYILRDILAFLKLGPPVPRHAADVTSTVLFESPIYRANLHYQVLPKPSEKRKLLDMIIQWILSKHKEDSGVVYCSSIHEAENISMELRTRGNIQTGVYYGNGTNKEKKDLHSDWQKGKIKVICATTAFGPSIGKDDVRFVIHQSVPESLEHFYQESSCAGRDGKDSDCVIYYHPRDGLRLSSRVRTDKDGESKFRAILSFVHDLKACRRVQVIKYFSYTSEALLVSWSLACDPCGQCDNCTCPAHSLQRKDVTIQAWQLFNIVQQVYRDQRNITLLQLVELAKGMGKVWLDLSAVCGGPVDLKREYIETLIVDLLLRGYLESRTACSGGLKTLQHVLIPCIQLDRRAAFLIRFSKADLEGQTARVWCSFRIQEKATSAKTKKNPKSVIEMSASTRAAGDSAIADADMDVDEQGTLAIIISDSDGEEEAVQWEIEEELFRYYQGVSPS